MTYNITTCCFYSNLGDNFDTQLNVGGGNSQLTNYSAFMLGIVLPDSYSQSLANDYKWHSKVLHFHEPILPFHHSLHIAKESLNESNKLDEGHRDKVICVCTH